MKAITVENLSKIYSVATAQEQGLSFREMLTGQLQSFFKKGPKQEPFYALNNVSFEVEQGEVLGIIGKNGSGKSTLLKILSRITAPTSGRAIVRGRVASLLEVGTGFHAELTGRENIFMSGIILGMKRWEINKHFDEIVSFAGVEKFLDIPVKKYSSGMRLRLAFSVAAHLQPEILLIDEVLAVGDYEFEKKCLKIMEGISNQGRTILFVSHNMDTIRRLCSKILFLQKGQCLFLGPTHKGVSLYLGYDLGLPSSNFIWVNKELEKNKFVSLHQVKIIEKNSNQPFLVSEPVIIEVEYTILLEGRISFALSFYNKDQLLLFTAFEGLSSFVNVKERKKGLYTVQCVIPKDTFREDRISIAIMFIILGTQNKLIDSNLLCEYKNILSFIIEDPYRRKNKDFIWGEPEGVVRPKVDWSMSYK